MKRLIYLAIILCTFAFAYYYELPSICDKPIPYTIGNIDPEFNLDQEQVLSNIKEAETYWEIAVEKNLFEYAPTAKKPVLIEMIYDERQAIAAKVNAQQTDVSGFRDSLQTLVGNFNKRSEELEQRVSSLNNKISEWNKSDAKTENEYKALVAEQSELEQRKKQMDAEAKTLKQNTKDINLKIDKLNGNILTFQTIVKEKPEEGLYDSSSKTITIYYNNTHRELIHTIEHELGHSLGLNHLSNPLAIMYSQTNGTVEPTADDLSAVARICKKETLVDKVIAIKWDQTVKKLLSGII